MSLRIGSMETGALPPGPLPIVHGVSVLCDTVAHVRAELVATSAALEVLLATAEEVCAALPGDDLADAIGRLGHAAVSARRTICHACDEDSRCPEHSGRTA